MADGVARSHDPVLILESVLVEGIGLLVADRLREFYLENHANW